VSGQLAAKCDAGPGWIRGGLPTGQDGRSYFAVKKVVSCVTAALVLACPSCNKNDIYPVSGKVTYKGSPASGAVVFFHRQGGDASNEPVLMGIVQEDGSFELVCGSRGKGAPPGDYDVLIVWTRVRRQGQGRPQHGPDQLKGRYADRKRPRLHATVEAGATTLPAFALTDEGPVQQR
jgi:hypothetical protein